MGGGGGAGKWEGRQEKFTPLFRGKGGGGQKFFTLDLGKREGGGGQKRLKVDIISFGFFLPEPHDN